MSQSTHPVIRRCLASLLAATLATVASAQAPRDQATPARSADATPLRAELVKTGLYMISGGGGNSLLRLSASGSILIGGKRPGQHRALMSQIRRISKLSDLPVRVLIVTDPHDHHTGNNAQFAAAGIPLIAQENAVRHLPAGDPSDRTEAPRTITFAHDYKLRMGGVEVQLFHFGNAHTAGDTVVYFPDLKVVAVGELFTPDTPEADVAAGGSLVNWGPVLAQLLALDFDTVVASTGPLASRADLQAFKAKVDTLISRASTLVRSGVPRDQLMTQLKTDDLGWAFKLTDDQIEHFYADLSRTP